MSEEKFKFYFFMKDWKSGGDGDVSTYTHGEGRTFMYNPSTKLSCCLGLLSKQCGVPLQELESTLSPIGAANSYKPYAKHPVLKKLLSGDRSSGYTTSNIADKLIYMNDELFLPPRDRAEEIAKYMRASLSIDVEIVE